MWFISQSLHLSSPPVFKRQNSIVPEFSVLFVCMGNICRSPTAEGVFRYKVREAGLEQRVLIDSAGTHAFHIGESPDRRSQRHAQARGYDLSMLRARAVGPEDFSRFDLLLAMDLDNLALLEEQCPEEELARCRLFLSFAPQAPVAIVPDPYFGTDRDFDRVLDLVELASTGLLVHIQKYLAQQD
ncbi:Low molecular weight protein-tyrosine-phosphatase YfkJ [mine drainage metagenome]|uniref:protein-tyrosine-phosphatase n=1 Tax=mine drainage metagenome TaxID=410659 RepID=A0A1J5Q603_9ZZZZ